MNLAARKILVSDHPFVYDLHKNFFPSKVNPLFFELLEKGEEMILDLEMPANSPSTDIVEMQFERFYSIPYSIQSV